MRAAVLILLVVLAAGCGRDGPVGQAETGRVSRVTDGDTVRLADGRRIRLVQIDAPEVSFTAECYGVAATRTTQRLLPRGTKVRLEREPETDDIDDFGRELRYVIRDVDDLNVNLSLVATGAATPYFYARRRGRYADQLERSARAARAAHAGLWGHCPQTPLDPYRGVQTGPLRNEPAERERHSLDSLSS